jgi:hypothetical protein
MRSRVVIQILSVVVLCLGCEGSKANMREGQSGVVLLSYGKEAVLVPSKEFLDANLGADRGRIYYAVDVGWVGEKPAMINMYFTAAGKHVILPLPNMDIPIPMSLYDPSNSRMHRWTVHPNGSVDAKVTHNVRLPSTEPLLD